MDEEERRENELLLQLLTLPVEELEALYDAALAARSADEIGLLLAALDACRGTRH